MKQDTYTLHKQARRHYRRNRVIVGGIDELWQMDLADMQAHAKENDGYRYLLVCIDVFSKFVWVIPLKNKTGPALVTAFKEILESGRKPQKYKRMKVLNFSITFQRSHENRRDSTLQYVQ